MGRFRIRRVNTLQLVPLLPEKPLSLFASSDTPHQREGLKRTTERNDQGAPLHRHRNYACASYLSKIVYELSY